MAKAEATVEELVGMRERGELRWPDMQRRYDRHPCNSYVLKYKKNWKRCYRPFW